MDVNETGRPETAPAQVGALGPTVDVQSAARLLGIGRTTAYQLASRNALPVPVVRIGRSLRIPSAPLLALLGLAQQPENGASRGETDPGPGSDQASSLDR